MLKLPLPQHWTRNAVRIILAGAGGNGSQMLTGLARIHTALTILGGRGLHVTVADPDTVTAANIGRQLFSPSDIGLPKASVLVHRINLFFGLDWSAKIAKFQTHPRGQDLIIGCLDTAAARRDIAKHAQADYWLDLGNTAHTGQVILGGLHCEEHDMLKPDGEHAIYRLPNVLELFPNLADPTAAEARGPSCSLAESLQSQDLMINQTVATAALALLWQWLRTGHLDYQGAFINLQTHTTRPLPIDPETWTRMAPPSKRNAPVKKKK